MICEKCGGTGWMPGLKLVELPGVTPYKADYSVRCECHKAAPKQESGEGTVTGVGIKKLFGNLCLLHFFPADEESRQALAVYIEHFASTDAQLDWLGNRAVMLYRAWPGAMELRALFNSRFIPKDGIPATSEIYPDGIPSEKPEPLLALPPGVEAVEDPAAIEAGIRAVAEYADRNRVTRKPRAPETKIQPITQADIDRVLEQQRANQQRAQEKGNDEIPTAE